MLIEIIQILSSLMLILLVAIFWYGPFDIAIEEEEF